MNFYNKYNFLINEFTSDDTNKPEITGVYITHSCTVATDSYVLIEVESVKGNSKDFPQTKDKKIQTDWQSFILPAEKAKDALKLFKKPNRIMPILDNAVVLKRKKEETEMGTTDLETFNVITSKIIQGRYPNYRTIVNEIEKDKGYKSIYANANFLKKIAVFLNKFCDGIKEVEIQFPDDPDKPIVFHGKNGETKQNAKIILMPMRHID